MLTLHHSEKWVFPLINSLVLITLYRKTKFNINEYSSIFHFTSDILLNERLIPSFGMLIEIRSNDPYQLLIKS